MLCSIRQCRVVRTGAGQTYIVQTVHFCITYTLKAPERAEKRCESLCEAKNKRLQMQKATERLLVLTMLLFASVTESTAQSAANVAVIINEASPISRRVGDHYIKVRRVPPENVIRLTTSDEERISLLDYQRNIEAPIAEAL